MQARHVLPLCTLILLCCGACGGTPNRRPALHQPVTPPQEFRQETHAANNPGSLFAASEGDTLFDDARARRVGDLVVVKLVENTKAQNKAETTANKDSGNNYRVDALFGKTKVGFIPFVGIGPRQTVGMPVLNTTSQSDL